MLEKYVGRSSFSPKWILFWYFLRTLTTNSRIPFYPKRLSGATSVTHSTGNTLGFNILEQYFYIQQGSRTPITSKMGFFVTLVNGWKPLNNATKSSILNVAGTLDMPRNNVQKQPWWAIPNFTWTLLFLSKKFVTEVEDFKLVCLQKLALETALTALKVD